MCSCDNSFSISDGPVVENDLLQTFPYGSYDINTAIEWFESRKSYKIEEIDKPNNTIYATYNGNVDWSITAASGSGALKGFFVILILANEYSEEDLNEIYTCILEQVTELGGIPIKTWNSGYCTRFNFGGIQIDVRLTSSLSLSISCPI